MEASGSVEIAHDYSILGLIQNADPVVQGVMIGLLLCSIACWAIIFEKIVRLIFLNAQVSRLERVAAGSASVSRANRLIRLMTSVAEGERMRRDESLGEFQGRLERAAQLTAKMELRRMEGGLPFLATVASTAPFIGLFGTVWGIIHSFTSIAQAKDTSLAVVAPGIAEALIATAIGLAAAIPAVVAYNQISTSLSRAAERIGASIPMLVKQWAREPVKE